MKATKIASRFQLARLFAGLVMAVLPVAGARGATLALYTFPSNGVLAADSFAPGLVAGDVNVTGSSGALFTFAGYHVVNPPTNLNDTAAALRNVADSSEQAALDNANYFQFTLTPGSGQQLDFDAITFDWRRGGASRDRHWAAYISTDGFAAGGEANGFSSNTVRLGGVSPTIADTTWRSTNLTISALDSVATATTFRFYVWTSGTDGENLDVRFDNILVEGTVIPEPSTIALLLFAMAGLAFHRRRIGAGAGSP